MRRRPPAPTLRRDALRALMADRGWTSAELARRTGLSDSTICRLLDGTTRGAVGAIGPLMWAFPNLRFEDLFDTGRDTTSTDDGPREDAA